MIDLKFSHVSKRYRIRQERDDHAARHPLMRRVLSLRKRTQDFYALRDVSFEVPRAEALGLIGHNGAGKSTILKLLSNITTPTSGEITINGRLSALIEVGSGFHPELTGRENIYLNGSILGMRRREITEKFDRIVEFAGVSQFIDTPVKRFSSGMHVRLGFSIAAHLDPDILLLDEVLAVGDAAFQAKCLQRIRELKQNGTTIVFISHDLGAVEGLCDRVLLVQRGEIIAGGDPHDVIAEYQRAAANLSSQEMTDAPAATIDKKAAITSVAFYDTEGRELAATRTGGAVVARVNYTARERIDDAVFELFFYTGNRELLCHLSTEFSGQSINLERGSGIAEFVVGEIGLRPDIYYADATIKHRNALDDIDWQRNGATLRVDPGKMRRGIFYMPHEWRVRQRSNAVVSSIVDESEELSGIQSSRA
jgi:ABC-type polysaccharide/polyol phosphate transport system ATPase subunit